MNKKLYVFAGIIIVFLLISLGGVFFFSDKLGLSDETDYDSTPTQWSQEKDYIIEETNEGTIVTNKTAGFSFKVPNGWTVEGKKGIRTGEYWIDILSPETEFKRDEFGNTIRLLKGCGIRLNTLYDMDEEERLKNAVTAYTMNPELMSDREELIHISGYSSLKNLFITPEDGGFKTFGEIIQIHIPILKGGLIEFGTTMMPGFQAQCKKEFDDFLSGFIIS